MLRGLGRDDLIDAGRFKGSEAVTPYNALAEPLRGHMRDPAMACTRRLLDMRRDLIAKIALRLADRAEPIVAALNDKVDDLEDVVLDEDTTATRRDLADVRRMSILIRRFMFPQRDALTTLEIEDLPWMTRPDRTRVREASERTTRLAE